jgi:hypothetical protein
MITTHRPRSSRHAEPQPQGSTAYQPATPRSRELNVYSKTLCTPTPTKIGSTGRFANSAGSYAPQVLLRYLSEPALRETITAITNRVEAFHGFAGWLGFGAEDGVIAHNDPAYQ